MSVAAVQNRLEGAPAEYLEPAVRPTLEDARAWCHALATSHYENFHVATFFLPRRMRPHFESVYGFSRVADDLGDEVATPELALRLLGGWRALLHACYDRPAESRHPVFVALRPTIDQTGVPRALFDDLIQAFERDQHRTHYETLDELVDYSRLSANPVGRLVLWIGGYTDERRAQLSDSVCTGLQLANMWQDVAEDLARGRRYVPAEAMRAHGVTEAMLHAPRATPEFCAMLQMLVEDARTRLNEGAAIADEVDPELAVTLRLFVAGGHAALDGIVRQGYDVLAHRPSVSKAAKLRLLGGALLGKLLGAVRGGAAR